MQLNLTFTAKRPLALPLGHHAALQGFIYSLLRQSPEYSEFLHDIGYGDSPHAFKLFVFSTLRGKHVISDSKIIFTDKMYLDIRSPKQEFCRTIFSALFSKEEFELDHQPIRLENCVSSNKQISSGSIDIQMLSPLTLSTTYMEGDRKKTRFISPIDDDFADALNHNLRSKYEASFQKATNESVELVPLDFGKTKKYITKFNNHIYINAWNGKYRLSGSPEILSFLYDAGLGSRNSQGFGMFEEI